MLFDSVAYKTVVSNGLVLDKNGNKMSKRLGNGVDPFEIINKFGPDATRWYMLTNAQPWDNLKFDEDGISEVQRKFFGTLYNTYAFFALYANIDGFTFNEKEIPVSERPEIDRWILSELNTLIREADESYSEFEPTRAGRAIQNFVNEFLSNWYVRLCRRRFWKGEYTADKIAAYQTLYTCLDVVSKLIAPIAPFFADRLYIDLNAVTGKENAASVHLASFPVSQDEFIDTDLEQRMQMAQKISSMVLSLRKRTNIRVRQPLGKIMIPVGDDTMKNRIEAMKGLILSEVNVKELEFIQLSGSVLVKKIKPDFKALGPRYGKWMKQIAAAITAFSQEDIVRIETDGHYLMPIEGQEVEVLLSDVEIITEDIPGWVVANQGTTTVALDITLTNDLKEEGIARELINRIQNLRKDKGFDVTDSIIVKVEEHPEIISAVKNNFTYICSETLAKDLEILVKVVENDKFSVDLTDEISVDVFIARTNK